MTLYCTHFFIITFLTSLYDSLSFQIPFREIVYPISNFWEDIYIYLSALRHFCTFAFTNLLQSASPKIINLALGSPSGIPCSSRFKALQIFGSVSPGQGSSPIPLCTVKIFLELCFPHEINEGIEVFKVLQKHIISNCNIAEVDKSDEVLPVMKYTLCKLRLI